MFNLILIATLAIIPLYPKFPLLGVNGTFVSVRLEDIFLAAVFGFWLIFRLKNRLIKLDHPIYVSIVLYWLVGFVSLFCGITLIKTVEPQLGVLHWLRRIEYMAMFFIAYDFFRSLKQLPGIIQTILLVSFIVGLYGIGQQVLGLPIISTTNSEFAKGLALTLGPGARINSTFAGHYDLAAYSLFPLLLIVGLLSVYPHRWKLLLVLSLPIYVSMLISASRVNFAAFFLVSGLYLVYLRKKLWIIPLFIIMVVSFINSPQLIGRYRELIKNHFSLIPPVSAQSVDSEVPDALKPPAVPEDRSFNIRIQASWPKAIRAFEKNPLLGTGYSSVGLAVDSGYLRILAETGLFGLAAFLLIILRVLKPLWNMYLHPPSIGTPSIFFSSMHFAFIGLLMNAMFIDIFEASKIAIVTWTLLGIAQKTLILSRNNDKN